MGMTLSQGIIEVRNAFRGNIVQSPHFRIEAAEVKREIRVFSEFIHLVNDRAKNRI